MDSLAAAINGYAPWDPQPSEKEHYDPLDDPYTSEKFDDLVKVFRSQAIWRASVLPETTAAAYALHDPINLQVRFPGGEVREITVSDIIAPNMAEADADLPKQLSVAMSDPQTELESDDSPTIWLSRSYDALSSGGGSSLAL